MCVSESRAGNELVAGVKQRPITNVTDCRRVASRANMDSRSHGPLGNFFTPHTTEAICEAFLGVGPSSHRGISSLKGEPLMYRVLRGAVMNVCHHRGDLSVPRLICCGDSEANIVQLKHLQASHCSH